MRRHSDPIGAGRSGDRTSAEAGRFRRISTFAAGDPAGSGVARLPGATHSRFEHALVFITIHCSISGNSAEILGLLMLFPLMMPKF